MLCSSRRQNIREKWHFCFEPKTISLILLWAFWLVVVVVAGGVVCLFVCVIFLCQFIYYSTPTKGDTPVGNLVDGN